MRSQSDFDFQNDCNNIGKFGFSFSENQIQQGFSPDSSTEVEFTEMNEEKVRGNIRSSESYSSTEYSKCTALPIVDT